MDNSQSPISQESATNPTEPAVQPEVLASGARAETKANAEATDAEPTSSTTARQFQTTLWHQSFLAISSAFILFEVLFLFLYADKDWFAINLLPWGAPASLLALILAHGLLQWLEGPRGCQIFAPLLNGLPPVVYRRWILVNEFGFEKSLRFGQKRVVWNAIDSAELTFFGNLLLRSRLVSGSASLVADGKKQVDQNPPFLLFKLPFGVAAKADQQEFVRLLQKGNPECQFNLRLQKQVAKNDPPGSSAVLLIVSVFFLAFFMDVGFATFDYLEILKHYYLAELHSTQEPQDMASAKSDFEQADSMFFHPAPFSWVTRKLLDTDNTKDGIMQLRADTLWRLGDREQALVSIRKARGSTSKSFRVDLKLARMLTEMGREKEAMVIIDEAIEKSKDALVPRAYKIALLETKKNPNPVAAHRFFDIAMQEFDDRVFGEDPSWPPNVSESLLDVWHREDVVYVFERMIKAKQ